MEEVTTAKAIDDEGPSKIPSHEVPEIDVPLRETEFGGIRFNAVTSFIGVALLWGFAIYCMATPEEALANLIELRQNVAKHFTWFYIGANPAFTFFLLWITYRYGHIKLGMADEKPEFSDTEYFAMIFSAGVAVGLFFYGVSEPLWHRASHWYVEAGYRSQDEVDQWAIMLTAYHWGLAGWSPYCVVAISSGLASFRFGLPMTVRTSMYTLFGNYTWGWLGDFIDGFSIVATVAGICTSLGLGAIQIIAGFQRLGWFGIKETDDVASLTSANVGVIWVITILATLSVVSGLHTGIKFLAQLGFGIGMMLLVLVFCMEKTHFLLNLMVQTLGNYLQWGIFLLPFWTDAFGQLKDGEGRSPEGASATWWMDSWTVFYMAWWTAWACFVGLFIARISRGRTIKEVVSYCFVAPMLYSIIWFSVFGGAGLRQARQATELTLLGETVYNDTTHFEVPGNPLCYRVPQESIMNEFKNVTFFESVMPGVTPVCKFDTKLSTSAWFNVLYSFSFPGSDSDESEGFGPFLSALSIVAVGIYFITSSDSGSLVVDHLSANGRKEHHSIQRIFWAFSEGAVATALLVAGGADALSALQAASIVFGLPLCLFLFLMCLSIKHMCEFADANPDAVELPDPVIGSWDMPVFGGIFNILEYIVSIGHVHEDRVALGMHLPTSFQFFGFFTNIFFPFVSLWKILNLLDPKGSHKFMNGIVVTVYFLSFVTSIVMFSMSGINFGYTSFGWTFFLINTTILTNIRATVRGQFSIRGNIVGDFFASSFCYPQTLVQIQLQFESFDGAELKRTTKAVEA